VGAVISIAGEPIATSARGDDLHAEKRALASVDVQRHNLSEATVWTTLEPCTGQVRRESVDSCTDRLIRMRVPKVVIGILDPNQGVCGKGVLKLQEYGIEVALFPHDLAMKIRRLNDRFIQEQQSLGITITSPQPGDKLSLGEHMVRGTFINRPGRDVIALTCNEPVDSFALPGGWWPQGPVTPVAGSPGQWEARVQFGAAIPSRICIVKANDLGLELINFYEKLKETRHHMVLTVAHLYCRDVEHVRRSVSPYYWPLPMPMTLLPKGLDLQASVDIEIIDNRQT
jgi:pyrimidine deaminase RibD-like protein